MAGIDKLEQRHNRHNKFLYEKIIDRYSTISDLIANPIIRKNISYPSDEFQMQKYGEMDVMLMLDNIIIYYEYKSTKSNIARNKAKHQEKRFLKYVSHFPQYEGHFFPIFTKDHHGIRRAFSQTDKIIADYISKKQAEYGFPV